MCDPEPVLVLDEEVPDGPVDGGGGEAGHLALKHHVVAQRLHHPRTHSAHLGTEPGAETKLFFSIIIFQRNIFSYNFLDSI